MKQANILDLLERRLLAQQGNINKHAIYSIGPWVNTQILKMTSNRTSVQIHREIHRMALWFEAWAGSQEFAASFFPSSALSVYTDGPQPLLTHRQWYWGTCDLLTNDAQLFLSASHARDPGDLHLRLCTPHSRSCVLLWAHALTSAAGLPKCAGSPHYWSALCSVLSCPVLYIHMLSDKDEYQNLKYSPFRVKRRWAVFNILTFRYSVLRWPKKDSSIMACIRMVWPPGVGRWLYPCPWHE